MEALELDFDFEVVKDPKEIASTVELPFDRKRHLLLGDFSWLTWCRTVARNPRLFAYRHLETGNTVLAVWVYSPQETDSPVCVELETFPGDPTELWPHGLLPRELLAWRLQPKGIESPHKRRMREHENRFRAAMDRRKENDRGRQKAAKTLKNANLDHAAHMMSTHQIPYQAPDAQSEELARLLSR